MPLDHTDRPRGWGAASTAHDYARTALTLACMAGAVLLLAACNTGSMGEARRSQAYDQAETPQLSAQQATRTARTYFAGTGTPDPTMIPPPSVEALVITLGVNPDGSPAGSYLSVPADAGTVYATARLGNVVAGQRITSIFTDAFGNQMGGTETEMSANGGSPWLVAPLNLGGISGPGEFAVYYFSGGHQIGSLAFTITGAGSGAQLLPELPANPQARSTSAPSQSGQPTATSGNGNPNGQPQPGNQGDSGQWNQGGQQADGNWQQQADGTWQEQPADGQWQNQEDGQWQGQ